MGLEARIRAFRIEFGPRDWDLGVGTRIWASKLGGRVTDRWTEEKNEKIPHMCESKGRRSL